MRVLLCALALMASFAVNAQADTIFIGDDRGNVATWDTATNTGSYLGTITGPVSQVIGLAYDPATNSVLIFDRSARRVHTMNAMTGASSLLFTTPGVTFQGGAVANGLVYGIDENSQRIVAYSFAGVNQGLTGPVRGHRHALGVDAMTGQLYDARNNSDIRKINADGTTGAFVVTPIPTTYWEDIEYFGGDFLGVRYDRVVSRIDGTTGLRTTFLTGAQTSALDLGGSLSGVALKAGGRVPEPASMALLAGGLIVVAVRRRKARA